MQAHKGKMSLDITFLRWWCTVCPVWFWPSTFVTLTKYVFLGLSWYRNHVVYSVKHSFQIHLFWWPLCLVNCAYFNSNFMFFEKIIRGSYVFGQNWIYHMIPIAMRVPKIYVLLVLEMLKVGTTLGTLCPVNTRSFVPVICKLQVL